MKFNERIYDLVVVCDVKGIVQRIVKNNLSLATFPIIGQSILNYADPSCKRKTIKFFHQVLDLHTSLNWEINLKVHNKLRTFSVSGVSIDYKYILLGFIDDPEILHLYDEISKVNNEQMNKIRELYKENAYKAKTSELYPKPNISEDLLYKSKYNKLLSSLVIENLETYKTTNNYMKTLINNNKTQDNIYNEQTFNQLLNFFNKASKYFDKLTSEFNLDDISLNVKLIKAKVAKIINEVIAENQALSDIKKSNIISTISEDKECYLDEKLLSSSLKTLLSYILKINKSYCNITMESQEIADNMMFVINYTSEDSSIDLSKRYEFLIFRKIIELHKGSVWTSDQEDKSSIFFVLTLNYEEEI